MSENYMPVFTMTKTATGAITKNRFVTIAGALAGAGATALGVANSGAAIGENFPVLVLGTAVVEASAAIASGAAVEATAVGKAVTRTTGVVLGRALEAASADGDKIEVLLIPN